MDALASGITVLNALYVCAVLLAICSVVIVYLVVGVIKAESDLNFLKKRKHDLTPTIVEYLSSQAAETRSFIHDETHDFELNNKVVALRTAYLNIEKRSLEFPVSSEGYWRILDEKLLKLLNKFMPQLFGSEAHIKGMKEKVRLLTERVKKLTQQDGEGREGLGAGGGLSGVEDLLLSDSIKGKGSQYFVDKIDKIVGGYENIESRDKTRIHFLLEKFVESSTSPIDKFSGHMRRQSQFIDDLSAEVKSKTYESKYHVQEDKELIDFQKMSFEKNLEKIKKENRVLNMELLSLRHKLHGFSKDTQGSVKDSGALMRVTSGEPSGVNFDSLGKISEEVNLINENEILRLRGVVSDQRRSMTDMEDAIRILESKAKLEQGKVGGSDELVSRLKLGIRESESCIAVLESEINLLKARLEKQLAEPPQQEPESLSAEERADFEEQLWAVKAELDSHELKRSQEELVLSFLHDIMEADSLEDAAFLLYQTLVDSASKPSLLVRHGSKEIELAINGKMQQRYRMLLSSMQAGEVNVADQGGRVMFNFRNVSGVLEALDNTSLADMQKDVIDIIQVFDKAVEKIAAYQDGKTAKKVVQLQVNTIKKVALDVDNSMKNLLQRTEQSLEIGAAQYQDIARSQGMKDSQLRNFDAVTEQLKESFQADAAIRAQVRKKFMAIVDSMEGKA